MVSFVTKDLRNTLYSTKRAKNKDDTHNQELGSIHSVEGLTRGGRSSSAPGPINPSTAQNFISDQFDFLQRDTYSPYSRYGDDEPLDRSRPSNMGDPNRGIQDNFSYGPPRNNRDPNRSFGGTRPIGDGSDNDSTIGKAKGLVSHFNYGYVPDRHDQHDGRSNGYRHSHARDTRLPPTGRDNPAYTISDETGGFRDYRPSPRHGNGVKTMAPLPPITETPVVTQSKPDKQPKDTYYAKHKRCLLSVILVIVAFLVIAVVAILVLYFLGFFNSDPAINVPYNGEIKFNATWTPEMSDKTSQAYKDVESNFTSLMANILDNSTHQSKHTITLTNIYPGSIRCIFTLLLSSVDNTIESLIQTGLKTLYDAGVTSWFPEEVSISISTTTTAPLTTEAVTTMTVTTTTLVYPTPGRTTPDPAPPCKPIPQSLCTNFGYDKTGTENPSLFASLYPVVQRHCYNHSLLFACTASYPACSGNTQRYPCMDLCLDFIESCGYPLNCAGFLDDDVDTLCFMSPDSKPTNETVHRNPPPAPCAYNQFMCGDGHCINSTKACDTVDDCGDFSDEIHCNDTSSKLDCDFEANDACDYTNHNRGDFSWSVQVGSTPSLNTGPLTDHTNRTEQGHYLYAEASGQYSYSVARLISPEVSLDAPWCYRFYYHMLGSQVESLKVYHYVSSNDDKKEQLLWQRSRDHGDIWRPAAITLPTGSYQVLLEATRGVGFLGDIAIDDITARPGTCPTASTGCSSDEFSCANGNCVALDFACDTFNDCGDLSDEKQCNCSDNEFKCKFGMCIPDYMRCDGMTQCADASDEAECDGVCSNGRHKCADGTCIMSEWVCDHEGDCPDNSDELQCPTCQPGEFKCRDFGCVNASEICDGSRDCSDGSDEFTCFKTRQEDKIVEVRNDNTWKGLCAEGLPNDTANTVCQLMGYRAAVRHSVVQITGGHFMKFTSSGNPSDNFLAQPSSVESCTNNEVFGVECVVPDCGKQSQDHHTETFIVNGEDALPGQWPWQIGLYYRGRFSCGGSLVSHHHVITAAHCLKVSKDPKRYTVILGATFRTPTADANRIIVNVSNVNPNPGYTDAVWGDDIAVLTLDRYVEYNDFIKPICLPNPVDYFPATSQCYTSGWGRTDYYNTSSVPVRLQEAKMKLWSDKKCGQSHINFVDSMTCAGYRSGHISNCPGDSGGPLQCRDEHGYWKLYGVFSFFVRGCNVPLQPPVFTKVQSHLPWVHDNMACVFTCGNKRCLWDEDLLCNGVDDCGDLTDEISPCRPDINCAFEDGTYQCGYSHTDDTTKSMWRRLTRSGSSQQGPLTDHTYGNSSGHFMYGGADRSILVSPIQNQSSPSCLQFAYHLRGAAVGTLDVSVANVPDNVDHPSRVDLSSTTPKFTTSGNQLDIWNSKRINLAAGRFVVAFSGISRNPLSLPLLAIDDVKLFDSTCAEITCQSGEVSCDDRCVSQSEICNYHIKCLNTADENNCTGQQMIYSCDMESYGLCGVEQDPLFASDHRDWIFLEVEDIGNGPPGDHTTGSYGGHVLYLSTLVGQVGQSAATQLAVSVPSEGKHCMHFYYSMISTGALRVQVCNNAGKCTMVWNTQNVTVADWKHVQVDIQPTVGIIQIWGYTGPFQSGDSKGYIAIDDISIKNEACYNQSCRPSDQFTCGNGQCIDRFFTCDGFVDCDDGSDESSQTCVCTPDSFRCDNGNCIKGALRCDGRNNCADGSDEHQCTTCKPGEFQCTDSKCKNPYVVCDGYYDCADQSDDVTSCTCNSNQFQCGSGGFCIPGFRYCDGTLDCSDGSDEPVTGCNSCDPRWRFDCGDGNCIPKEQKCDGIAQCANGADETPGSCAFKCNDGTTLTMVQYCNGVPDCSQAEDEPVNCECPYGYTNCSSGGCVPATVLCNGVYNCKDHSDEVGCTCSANTAQCTSGKCIGNTQSCNSLVDCDDWSDELQCSTRQACSTDQFACGNGRCIPVTQKCNRDDNCGDGSDEVGCPCSSNQMQCTADDICIPNRWKCDGVRDCSDGQDESSCIVCTNQFKCPSDDSCIALSLRCDGSEDCADGADEAGCERISNAGFLEGLVENTWLPICSSDWNNNWNTDICRRLGKGSPTITLDTISQSQYLLVNNSITNVGQFSSSLLYSSTQCASGKGLKLACGDLACSLPSAPTAALIIGGGVTEDKKWPWMASILYLGGPRCGGVLINSQWVVTAAHCFKSLSLSDTALKAVPQYFKVILGTNKQSYPATTVTQNDANRQEFGVTTILTHELYSVDATKQGMLYDDIALMKLDRAVTGSDRIRPLCLPEQDQSINSHRECYSAGWGFVDSQADPVDFAPVIDLRDARFRLWTDDECTASTAWSSNVNVTKHVCAGLSSGAVATCNGDSGGPLMCKDLSGRWDLVGITSAGSNCGQGSPPNKPGVFTKVSYFVDWINQKIAANR